MSCNTYTLMGLNARCKKVNLGGVKKMYVVPYEGVTYTINPLSHTIVPTLVSGYQIAEYSFAKNSASMTSTYDRASNLFSNNIDISFNKMDSAKRLEMMALFASYCAVVIIDKNNQIYYLGKDYYVKSTAGGAATGQMKNDKNGYTLKLTDVSNELPYNITESDFEAFINGEVPPTPTVYTITVNATQHGTIVSDKQTAEEDETVTLVASAYSGYQLEDISATCGGEEVELTQVYDEVYEFIMPAGNVTVSGTFEQIPVPTYTVTVNPTQHGAIASNKQTAEEDETVTLTVTPDTGYQLSAITASYSGGTIALTQSSETVYTFTMPASNVTVSGTFEEIPVPQVTPFYFESRNDGNKVQLVNEGVTGFTVNLEYSTDGTNWSTWDKNQTVVNNGNKLYLRGNNPNGFAEDGLNHHSFVTNGQFNIGGDIRSLINTDMSGDTVPTDFCFMGLFNLTSIVTVSESLLSGYTTLTPYCYWYMFDRCTSLIQAPALPATTLASYCYSYMFYGCTSLTTAPELPAMTLTLCCYNNMFHGCTSLTTAPALPATTLASYCYESIFNGCTSLTTAPALPATTMAYYCYRNMFAYCTSLTTAPALPATTLDEHCYTDMFRGCTSLTSAPELPATTLTDWCYNSMFYGCTSLTTAPALPATTLATGCYIGMFDGCTSLTTAPELPATTLASYCYDSMFAYCTSLNYVKCLATNISASGCTSNWLRQVSSSGTFVKNPSMSSWPRNVSGIPGNWTVEDYFDYTNYIVFTALQNSSSVSLTKVGSPSQTAPALVYSTDGEHWYNWDYSAISVNNGGKVYICAKNSNTGFGDPNDGNKYYKFTTTGTFDLGGDIRALINRDASGTTIPSTRCFLRLFEETGVVNVESDFLSGYTTVTDRCYARMFNRCLSLVSAPELPATVVDEYSYLNMFSNCPNLNYIKCLATDISANGCTSNWVSGVANNGTFVKASGMTNWTIGDNGIPTNWTVQDA